MSPVRLLLAITAALFLLGLLTNGCNGIQPLANGSASPTPTPTGIITGTVTPTPAPVGGATQFAFVTNNGSDSVSVFTRASGTGNLTPSQTQSTDHLPLGIAIHPSLDDVYVAAQGGGTVETFSFDPNSGALTLANRVGVNQATGVAVSPNGNVLLATQGVIGGGQVQSFLLTNGVPSASPVSSLTGGQQPNQITFNPSGNVAYVTNLGTADISVYTVDQTAGTLTLLQQSVAAGGQPEFVAVTPNGSFAYVANETSQNIIQYSINSSNGELTAQSTTSLTSGGPTGLAVTPDGNFLMVALAQAAAVEVLSIDQTSGAVTPTQTLAGGAGAFQLVIDATQSFVYTANQFANNVSEFTLSNGTLTASQTATAGTTPTGIVLH
ncbi:MAG: lactonase family protein [Candidatus Xenobia bacterium]